MPGEREETATRRTRCRLELGLGDRGVWGAVLEGTIRRLGISSECGLCCWCRVLGLGGGRAAVGGL